MAKYNHLPNKIPHCDQMKQYDKTRKYFKLACATLIFFAYVVLVLGKSYSSKIEILTVYSQNNDFYLRSIPFDDEFPSRRGSTVVYTARDSKPLYTMERGFDRISSISNHLIIGDDGETIVYILPWDAEEEVEGLGSISIYKKGVLAKSYTKNQITGCDGETQNCGLVYRNFQLIDKEKSNWGRPDYKRVFKDGVDESEIFLADYSIFSFDNLVYLTDSNKKTHVIDMNTGQIVRSEAFGNLYPIIREKGRPTRVLIDSIVAPDSHGLPNLKDGKPTDVSLADFLGMALVDPLLPKDDKYKAHTLRMSCYLTQEGKLEIDNIEIFGKLPRAEIIDFFTSNSFDHQGIPKALAKWYFRSVYFSFRNKDKKIARQERLQELKEEREQYKKRLLLETINGVYIPKDLEDCFIQLDKLLKEYEKNEIKCLPSRTDMALYHHGLGMWIRNNWGLWGGSRLQKYFFDRKIKHPDDMSSVILSLYYDWLKGNKEIWKSWEKKPQVP